MKKDPLWGLGVLIRGAVRYTQRMGKLGGLALVVVMALSGCASAKAEAEPTSRVAVQPATVMNQAKVSEFVKDVQESGTEYATMPPADIAGMALELCQHYDGGFTTEDLRKSAGDKLAKTGETARLTVCPPR